MQNEKVFVNGFTFKRNDEAPDFVIGNITIKKDELVAFMEEHANEDGWVRIAVKKSKRGKIYSELDTWKPTKRKEEAVTESETDEEMPF